MRASKRSDIGFELERDFSYCNWCKGAHSLILFVLAFLASLEPLEPRSEHKREVQNKQQLTNVASFGFDTSNVHDRTMVPSDAREVQLKTGACNLKSLSNRSGMCIAFGPSLHGRRGKGIQRKASWVEGRGFAPSATAGANAISSGA